MANTITVNMGNKPCYDIFITKGFEALAEQLAKISLENKKVAIITDSQVGPIYAEKVMDVLNSNASKIVTYSFKAGESSKNLDTINEIYDFLLENNFTRSDFLIALGGGVVGDMTGFVAATYMRGIDFVQIPTSLLAQVDSSVGGKTGINLKCDDPSSVGADLICACVAAHHIYQSPSLLIDMGTATKLMVMDSQGAFSGAVIIPGVLMGVKSLSSGTAQLPQINLDAPKSVIGRNTVDCMKSGVVYGNASLIDGMIDRIFTELGTKLPIYATGGLAGTVIPHCRHNITIDDNLLLKGLNILYNKNQK